MNPTHAADAPDVRPYADIDAHERFVSTITECPATVVATHHLMFDLVVEVESAGYRFFLEGEKPTGSAQLHVRCPACWRFTYSGIDLADSHVFFAYAAGQRLRSPSAPLIRALRRLLGTCH